MSGIEIEHQTGTDAEVAVLGGIARQRAEERPFRVVGAGAGADQRLVFDGFFAV